MSPNTLFPKFRGGQIRLETLPNGKKRDRIEIYEADHVEKTEELYARKYGNNDTFIKK